MKDLTQCLVDVTLREGAQQKRDLYGVSVKDKLAILEAQLAVGIKELELTGYAPGEWYNDQDELTQSVVKYTDKADFIGLYFNIRGAEKMVSFPHMKQLGIFHTAATSGYRIKNYNQKDIENSYERLKKLHEWLEGNKLSLDVVVLSTTWGEKSEPLSVDESLNFIGELIEESKKCGADIKQLTLADTEGLATPESLTLLVTELKKTYPAVHFVAHLHPDPNEAEEIIHAGLDCGVDGWEGAWLGVGGSPFADGPGGNLDLRSLVKVYNDRGLPTGMDEEKIPLLLEVLKERLNETR